MTPTQSGYIFEEPVPFDVTKTRIGFLIDRQVFTSQSEYQSAAVYDLHFFGRTLFLDGILQTAEADEFIYHEMLCHPALFSHPDPKDVLIIGGGDGGSLEETLKHPEVRHVRLVEIDATVIEIAGRFLSRVCGDAFHDPRAEIIIEDGAQFLARSSGEFDVILLDLPDPGGPAEQLTSVTFYEGVKNALRQGGIISVQSGSLTTQPELVATITGRLSKVFKQSTVRHACIPSYQAGEYAFTIASESRDTCNLNVHALTTRLSGTSMSLRYWSPDIHTAAAVMPKYLSESLAPK